MMQNYFFCYFVSYMMRISHKSPQSLSGPSRASEGSLEFLFTPGRVTFLDETGLARRVALNQPLPDEVAESKDTWYFRRDPHHDFAEFSTCRSRDRSIDPGTLENRFDATPPADLPPPPKD
jgi:hypothetical protein